MHTHQHEKDLLRQKGHLRVIRDAVLEQTDAQVVLHQVQKLGADGGRPTVILQHGQNQLEGQYFGVEFGRVGGDHGGKEARRATGAGLFVRRVGGQFLAGEFAERAKEVVGVGVVLRRKWLLLLLLLLLRILFLVVANISIITIILTHRTPNHDHSFVRFHAKKDGLQHVQQGALGRRLDGSSGRRHEVHVKGGAQRQQQAVFVDGAFGRRDNGGEGRQEGRLDGLVGRLGALRDALQQLVQQ